MENPSVNRSLPDKAMDRIDHALGRPLWPLRETYRNHFATEAGGNPLSELSKSTHWNLSVVVGRMSFFQVTEHGRKALAAYLAKHDRNRGFVVEWDGSTTIVTAETAAKAKYRRYLDITDVLPDLSFGEFSKSAKVRKAA